MSELPDLLGKPVRLTNERLAHILEHPEMAMWRKEIDRALMRPETVVQSISDLSARLYYRPVVDPVLGDK